MPLGLRFKMSDGLIGQVFFPPLFANAFISYNI